MQIDRDRSLLAGIAALLIVGFGLLVGCGGNSAFPEPGHPLAPLFSSSPSAAASEGQLYTYRLVAFDQAGGTISYVLTAGPANAAISGDTLSWTPTHEQSRVANLFTVTATGSNGGTAAQSFSVTPAGTIRGRVAQDYYARAGVQDKPFDLSNVPVLAFVINADGAYDGHIGSGNADGTFTISDVPAGNYVLSVNGIRNLFTGQSDVVLTGNAVGRSTAARVNNATVNFSIDLNFPLQGRDRFEWCSPDVGSDITWNSVASSTGTWSASQSLSDYAPDAAQQDEVYLNHLVPTSLPNSGAQVVHAGPQPRTPIDLDGPFTLAETFSSASVTLASAAATDVSGRMEAVAPNATVRLNVKGTEFATFNGQLAEATTGTESRLQVLARPYGAPANTRRTWATLVDYAPVSGINSDIDAGDLPYGNPFSADEYSSVLLYRHRANGPMLESLFPPEQLQIGGVSSGTQTITHTYVSLDGVPGIDSYFSSTSDWMKPNLGGQIGVYTLPPNAGAQGVAPILGPVRSITVNGQPFASGKLSSDATPTLTWQIPSLGTADRYVVSLAQLLTTTTLIVSGDFILGTNTNYNLNCCFTYVTPRTTLTPPVPLPQGTYVVTIEADSFSGASPSAAVAPVGYSFVTAGAITVGAPTP